MSEAFKTKTMTANGVIQEGLTYIAGVIVSAHTSGTIKINGGITATEAGDKATAVLSIDGAIANNETVTLGGITYTFKTTLTVPVDEETYPNEVKIGASDAVTLDNLKLVIIGAGTEGEIGVKYSIGTVTNPIFTATTNTDTAQTIEAKLVGYVYNSAVLSETMAHGSWGAVSGGNDPAPAKFDTYTLPAGSSIVEFPEVIECKTGAYLVVGGTGLKYSVIYL